MTTKPLPSRFLTPEARAERLAKLMRRKGLTAYSVAARATKNGMSLAPIQVYRVLLQSAVHTPDPRTSTLIAIAFGCGVSAGFLIDRKVV